MNKGRNIMNYLTILLIFVATFTKLTAGQQCTEKGMRQFDANLARLLTIANSGRDFPSSKGAPLKKWCDESDRLVKGMENYKSKCFKDLSKQVFGVLLYAVKNAIRQYCRKDSQKLTEIIEGVPCIKKNDALVTKCYTNFIDGVLGSKNALNEKKIPYMCCEYARLFSCFEDKLTNAPSCTTKNVEALQDLIRSVVGNVIDLVCGDYIEGSDKCQSLGPAPKKKKNQKRARSFGPPVLDLLSSFPSV